MRSLNVLQLMATFFIGICVFFIIWIIITTIYLFVSEKKVNREDNRYINDFNKDEDEFDKR